MCSVIIDIHRKLFISTLLSIFAGSSKPLFIVVRVELSWRIFLIILTHRPSMRWWVFILAIFLWAKPYLLLMRFWTPLLVYSLGIGWFYQWIIIVIGHFGAYVGIFLVKWNVTRVGLLYSGLVEIGFLDFFLWEFFEHCTLDYSCSFILVWTEWKIARKRILCKWKVKHGIEY